MGAARTVWILTAVLSLGSSVRAADHSRFSELKGPFASGPAVTRACLRCHEEAGRQIQGTVHWLWLDEPERMEGRAAPVRLGKADVLNNFCIGVRSNEGHCAECHIGFGWEGKSVKTYDFKKTENVDCLVCHDTTEEYLRGHAGEDADLAEIAKNVGPTSARTCGSCHFNGGGGEGVKHGDLDPSLLDADSRLDVHMGTDGLGFACSRCHRGDTVAHRIQGRSASVSVSTQKITCEKCHGESPHTRRFIARDETEKRGAERLDAAKADRWSWKGSVLNSHTGKIACQTCHIPRFARRMATKLWWDWSKAGRRTAEGRAAVEFDDEGNVIYNGGKGEFGWGKNQVPEYRWYDGRNDRYLLGDTFDPDKILVLNEPLGGPGLPGSKIWPFKIHRGRQPYDAENRVLIQPKVWGPKGSGAYWSDFDWKVASREGMKAAGLPFSGEVGFARTDMYWPLTHMIAKRDEALGCADCHAREGRLVKLAGVYVPGQSRSGPLDALGLAAILASLMGIAGHALLRGVGGPDGLKRAVRRRRK